MERIELLLHPIRMRVILAVANRVLTTQQLAERLPDVAQTTLYRHINLLLESGILKVVRETKVRGTLERAFTLVKGAGRIDLQTSIGLSPETHEQIFTAFVAMLLADFKRAQAQPQEGIPPAIYSQQRLYLTAQELQQLNQQLDALLATYTDPSRQTGGAPVQPWLVTGIIMPDQDVSQAGKEQAP
jgi:DNA-binding transcriptional ArsR family regulator